MIMETYIDDLADGWAADIKGEPIRLGGKNGSSDDLVLPGAYMRASDMRLYYMTGAGHEAFKQGMPTSQMKEGTHYYLVHIIPYRPTPENFNGHDKEKSRKPQGKMHKQTPLRIKN